MHRCAIHPERPIRIKKRSSLKTWDPIFRRGSHITMRILQRIWGSHILLLHTCSRDSPSKYNGYTATQSLPEQNNAKQSKAEQSRAKQSKAKQSRAKQACNAKQAKQSKAEQSNAKHASRAKQSKDTRLSEVCVQSKAAIRNHIGSSFKLAFPIRPRAG